MSLPRAFTRSLSSTAAATAPKPAFAGRSPPHLLSLADLKVAEIGALLGNAHAFKGSFKEHQVPSDAKKFGLPSERELLKGRTVALMFSKRSTRTRVASESATALLGASEGCHIPLI